MNRVIFLMTAGLLLWTGCAQKHWVIPYQVTSVPPGAPVAVNGKFLGETPTEIKLQATKYWVGLAVEPGGWAFANKTYRVTAYPPPDSKESLYSKTKVVVVRPQESKVLYGKRLHFDLRFESVRPAQSETRERR